MIVTRGDVVLVRFVFSDGSGQSKLRPALVVLTDSLNGRIDDTIIAAISTKSHRSSPCQVLVDVATSEGKPSGLYFNSMVQCENLLTIDTNLFHSILGHLPESLMNEVNTALKTALGLN